MSSSSLAFTSSTQLAVHGLRTRITPTCTLAPDRTQPSSESRKSAKSTSYRVLPADLPESQRPPRPPQNYTLPFLGLVLDNLLGRSTTVGSIARRLNTNIFRSWFLLHRAVYVVDYNAVSEILRTSSLFRSSGAQPMVEAVFGTGTMLTLDGAEHTRVRGVWAPAFAPGLFQYYFGRVQRRARATMEAACARGKLELDPMFREHYLAITIELTAGVDAQMTSRLCTLFTEVQRGFFTVQFGPKWNKCMRARDEIMQILRDVTLDKLRTQRAVIEKLREYGEDTLRMGAKDIPGGEVDVLTVAIANSSLPTERGATVDEDVLESLGFEMMLLWFAGYATSAATSSCASFELGQDAALWAQLRAEQDALVAENNGEVEVTFDQVARMPLLESFIYEVVRLHPAAPGLFRKTSEDLELLGKYVPKGSFVFADIYGAHRGELYEDAEQLKVDRFVKREGVEKPPNLLAFGPVGSPHYCLGAAFAKVLMKTTLATLLRGYEYELDPTQSKKYEIVPENVPKDKVRVTRFARRAVA